MAERNLSVVSIQVRIIPVFSGKLKPCEGESLFADGETQHVDIICCLKSNLHGQSPIPENNVHPLSG